MRRDCDILEMTAWAPLRPDAPIPKAYMLYHGGQIELASQTCRWQMALIYRVQALLVNKNPLPHAASIQAPPRADKKGLWSAFESSVLLQGGKIELGAPTGRWQMIVVYRGKHCPVSKNYLASLQQIYYELDELGVEVIAVSGDGRERAEAFVSPQQPESLLLSKLNTLALNLSADLT